MSLANCLHMHFPWKNNNAVLKKLEPILWDEIARFVSLLKLSILSSLPLHDIYLNSTLGFCLIASGLIISSSVWDLKIQAYLGSWTLSLLSDSRTSSINQTCR